jgi:hypothetical protein
VPVEDERDAPEDGAVLRTGHQQIRQLGSCRDIGEDRHVLARREAVADVGPDGELRDAREVGGGGRSHHDGADPGSLHHVQQPMRLPDLVSDAP